MILRERQQNLSNSSYELFGIVKVMTMIFNFKFDKLIATT